MHFAWERYTDGNGDDMEIANGVYDAFRKITSVGQARKECEDYYIQAHYIAEPEDVRDYNEVPF